VGNGRWHFLGCGQGTHIGMALSPKSADADGDEYQNDCPFAYLFHDPAP
jgi:hypothetical protein